MICAPHRREEIRTAVTARGRSGGTWTHTQPTAPRFSEVTLDRARLREAIGADWQTAQQISEGFHVPAWASNRHPAEAFATLISMAADTGALTLPEHTQLTVTGRDLDQMTVALTVGSGRPAAEADVDCVALIEGARDRAGAADRDQTASAEQLIEFRGALLDELISALPGRGLLRPAP